MTGSAPRWGKACIKASIRGLTFQDLRGQSVTRLAIAGCTVQKIAATTGRALSGAQAILDAHYMGGGNRDG